MKPFSPFDQPHPHSHHHSHHFQKNLWTLLLLFNIIIGVASRTSSSKLPRTIRIGGLFSADQLEQQLVFHAAIERINAHYVNRTVFEPVVEYVPKEPNAFLTHFKTCSLLRHGPVALVGPVLNEVNSGQVQSICEHLEVPHIETQLSLDYGPKSDLSVHMFPHLSTLTSVYLELITAWQWTVFAVVYQQAESLLHFKDFFEEAKKNGWEMKFFQLPGPEILSSEFSYTSSYREVLWKLKESKLKNILLDVRSENLVEVLRQAQQVGLLTRKAHFLITSLDLHTLDLEYFRHSQTNITSLRIVQEDHPLLKSLLAEWPATSARFMPPQLMVARPRHGHVSAHSAMIFDGIELLAKALVELETFETREISCEEGSSWQYGATILNYVRQVHLEGLTGYVAFDALTGFRSNVSFEVISTMETDFEVIARWNGSGRLERTSLWNKHSTSEDTLRLIRVTTVMNDPFMMLANNSKELRGNDRYEGYIVDLMKEIAKLMRFRFEINLVKDKNYGNLNKFKVWDGMVGEVLREEADLAAADLTITSERELVVDFTHPFMSTGISILFKRPIIKETSLWSFLSPFDRVVWMYLLAVFAGVSLVLFYVGRFTPYEWTNPHPCPHHEPVLENTLTTRNSFWCTIGSLMQQGSDVAPKALSTRIITSIWYFFTLIIVSSYTANLAAFLTVENVPFPFKDVAGLAESNVEYGCLGNGATHKFFNRSKIPIYQKIAQTMEKNADRVLVKKNSEGREKVEGEDGKYAFFMESATIEYIQERYCNLTQIGGLLDNKGYGIATKKGSPLRGPLTEAILKLQENGVLHMLKDRWWKQKGGGQCIAKPAPAMTELGLRNLGGVFLVLAVGGLVAIFLAVCEFLFKTKLASEGGDYGRNLWADFTFALSCWESTKVLKRKSVKSLSGSTTRISSENRIVVSPSTEAFPLTTYS